ncbi:hypothetical protein [Lactobacillus crispatus]|uniref:Uncharacterized protein n=1 Tax=Lactobacillus crispatus TaxID=47770 RepID=A0A7H9E7X0_9LACO|nr:hypothetical protein [Lactobacillus crispatus]QLL73345.1 hypothetical protein GTO85_02640 [Lactobacillus crispatus]
MVLSKQDKSILRKLHNSQGLTQKAWEEKIMVEFVQDLISGTKSAYKDAVLEVAGKKELSEQLEKLQIDEPDKALSEKNTSSKNDDKSSNDFHKTDKSI